MIGFIITTDFVLMAILFHLAKAEQKQIKLINNLDEKQPYNKDYLDAGDYTFAVFLGLIPIVNIIMITLMWFGILDKRKEVKQLQEKLLTNGKQQDENKLQYILGFSTHNKLTNTYNKLLNKDESESTKLLYTGFMEMVDNFVLDDKTTKEAKDRIKGSATKLIITFENMLSNLNKEEYEAVKYIENQACSKLNEFDKLLDKVNEKLGVDNSGNEDLDTEQRMMRHTIAEVNEDNFKQEFVYCIDNVWGWDFTHVNREVYKALDDLSNKFYDAYGRYPDRFKMDSKTANFLNGKILDTMFYKGSPIVIFEYKNYIGKHCIYAEIDITKSNNRCDNILKDLSLNNSGGLIYKGDLVRTDITCSDYFVVAKSKGNPDIDFNKNMSTNLLPHNHLISFPVDELSCKKDELLEEIKRMKEDVNELIERNDTSLKIIKEIESDLDFKNIIKNSVLVNNDF